MIRPPFRLASSQSYAWAVAAIALPLGGHVPDEAALHDALVGLGAISGLLLWVRCVFSELDPKHDRPRR